jgi:hypothetical protein
VIELDGVKGSTGMPGGARSLSNAHTRVRPKCVHPLSLVIYVYTQYHLYKLPQGLEEAD